jgi:hypothetical protein
LGSSGGVGDGVHALAVRGEVGSLAGGGSFDGEANAFGVGGVGLEDLEAAVDSKDPVVDVGAGVAFEEVESSLASDAAAVGAEAIEDERDEADLVGEVEDFAANAGGGGDGLRGKASGEFGGVDADFAEAGDGLGDAVFEDGDVFRGEARDIAAALVANDDIDENFGGFRADGRGGFLGQEERGKKKEDGEPFHVQK